MKLEEKREIKTFPFTNTLRTRGTFLHPSWSKAPPVLLHSLEQFVSQQHLHTARNIFLISDLAADLCLSVPSYQNHTGAVTWSSLGVRASRMIAEGSSAFTTITD